MNKTWIKSVINCTPVANRIITICISAKPKKHHDRAYICTDDNIWWRSCGRFVWIAWEHRQRNSKERPHYTRRLECLGLTWYLLAMGRNSWTPWTGRNQWRRRKTYGIRTQAQDEPGENSFIPSSPEERCGTRPLMSHTTRLTIFSHHGDSCPASTEPSAERSRRWI